MIDATTASLISLFRDAGLEGVPCDEWMIRDLEQQLGVEFPPAYKAFLSIAGNGCWLLEGSHYAVEDDLASLQRHGKRIMKHNGSGLSEDAFVFLVHQGYACNFFLVHDGEDPPVYECVEGMPPAQRIAAHFSEWFLNEIARHRAFREGSDDGK